MSTVRDAWTDERLDDQGRRMEAGFDRVDRDLREVRVDMRELRTEMNARFDALQRLMLQMGGGLTAAIVAAALANHL